MITTASESVARVCAGVHVAHRAGSRSRRRRTSRPGRPAQPEPARRPARRASRSPAGRAAPCCGLLRPRARRRTRRSEGWGPASPPAPSAVAPTWRAASAAPPISWRSSSAGTAHLHRQVVICDPRAGLLLRRPGGGAGRGGVAEPEPAACPLEQELLERGHHAAAGDHAAAVHNRHAADRPEPPAVREELGQRRRRWRRRRRLAEQALSIHQARAQAQMPRPAERAQLATYGHERSPTAGRPIRAGLAPQKTVSLLAAANRGNHSLSSIMSSNTLARRSTRPGPNERCTWVFA